MAELKLHTASKSFGTNRIFNDLSLSIKTGDVLGLFGRNGSGKSTLLKILFGTLRAKTLKLEIDEHFFGGSGIIQNRKIGYLPQFSFLPQNTMVRTIIPRFFPNHEDQDRIFYDPGIARIDDRKINQLSLGERRYLELVLIGNLDHPFLMLDEPFSMVEPLYAERISAFVEKLREKKGIILTDHYYENVWNVSTKRMLLKDGKLYFLSNKEELREMGYLRAQDSN